MWYTVSVSQGSLVSLRSFASTGMAGRFPSIEIVVSYFPTLLFSTGMFWCPYMVVINVSVDYNGGLLPDIILLVDPMSLHWGTPLIS